jgi:general secretion pathway protein H
MQVGSGHRSTRGTRARQAGVTLVEVLVVLVLIGVMAGVVGLGLGQANRSGGLERDVQLLIARLNRAADEAVLTGLPVAFVWTRTDYAFLALQDQGWVPHPVAILGSPHELDRGTSFVGEAAVGGGLVIPASLSPATGAALRWEMGAGQDATQIIVFDGMTARAVEAGDRS